MKKNAKFTIFVWFEVERLRMHIYKSSYFVEVLPDTENHRQLLRLREMQVQESKLREEEERRILEKVRKLFLGRPSLGRSKAANAREGRGEPHAGSRESKIR